MAGLGSLAGWRHGVVAVAVLGGSALALTGLIGSNRTEHIENKQIVVTPDGENGVRIREVVDEDFGRNDRRGYERLIPNDFGVPVAVEASSPDAPADVTVEPDPDDSTRTRIRVGDPDTTVSGQHRYVLTYTLPDAQLTTGQLALDLIDNEEDFDTDHLEIVVTGLDLDDPLCNVGADDATGGCTLGRDGATYTAEIDPLEAHSGVTIGGTITGRTDAIEIDEPPLPERRTDRSLALAAAMVPIGALSAGGVYLFARRRGRNEVFAGGAADAAYGSTGPLPPPGAPPAPVRFVPDDQMGALATTEFVPPTGIAPWQGAVLVNERIDEDTVSAWFSGHAATDVLTIQKLDGHVVIAPGPKFETAAPQDAAILGPMFAGAPSITLDGYDKAFATAWRAVRAEQQRSIVSSRFWKRLPPVGGGFSAAMSFPFLIVIVVWFVIGAGSLASAALGVFAGPIGALLFGLVVPALAAYAMYRSLLPARSAVGSA
ncbi:MAG: hypothetical protein ABW122_13310, partial [Ilumatobacteraceae bacterium]